MSRFRNSDHYPPLKSDIYNLQLKIEDIMNQEELEKDNSGMIAMLPMAPAGETC